MWIHTPRNFFVNEETVTIIENQQMDSALAQLYHQFHLTACMWGMQ